MRYLILGATEARDEAGLPLHLGGSRTRALLAALALRGDGAAAVPGAVLSALGRRETTLFAGSLEASVPEQCDEDRIRAAEPPEPPSAPAAPSLPEAVALLDALLDDADGRPTGEAGGR